MRQCFPRIAEDLLEQGWSLRTGFLAEPLCRQLAEECRAQALTPAGIGRGSGQQVREHVRGDRIHWLGAGDSAAVAEYLALMDELRLVMNQRLFLGLEDFEGHFASYPPGAFYQRHLDRFRDDDRRTLTALVYLNQDWRAEDAGALRLYLPGADGERELDIPPLGGSLLLFMSAEFPHEVLPTRRERLSLTGWFRRRGDGL